MTAFTPLLWNAATLSRAADEAPERRSALGAVVLVAAVVLVFGFVAKITYLPLGLVSAQSAITFAGMLFLMIPLRFGIVVTHQSWRRDFWRPRPAD